MANDQSDPGTGTAAKQPAAPTRKRKAYYHLYASADGRYQRGLHLFTSMPAPDGTVKMPGFPGVKLSIARYTFHAGNTFKIGVDKKVEQRDGKPVFLVNHYGKDYEVVDGDPVVYEAPGQEDGAQMDSDRLDAENDE